MNKIDFYRFIEKGAMQGVCRYFEYWFIYDNVPVGAKVLEIGGGFSALGQALKEKHCEVVGLEIDGEAIEYQNERGVATYLNTYKTEFENQFDVVIAGSSIEHFDPENDGDVIQIEEVKKYLKPNGLFIIAIPTGDKYIKSRGKPAEKVYSMDEYMKRFLNGFMTERVVYYKGSEEVDPDLNVNPKWKYKSNVITDKAGDGVGLCAVLRKI